jgi:hypothetical protein
MDTIGVAVERKPLAQLLEDMLYEGGDAGLEVCLAETASPREADDLTVRDEYARRYRRAVESIEAHRGAVSFSGARGTPGLPEWLEAEYASCWSDAAGVIYVAISRASSDGSMRLIGGGRPHPVRPQAITLLPSAL